MLKSKRWIAWIDVTRLALSLSGLAVIAVYVFAKTPIDLDFWLSNIFAAYVFLMGVKYLLIGKNRNLAIFYIFFGTLMALMVHVVQQRFS